MTKAKQAAEESAELKVDPLHEARERFAYAQEAWGDDRKRYIDDLKFINGEHWDKITKDQREKDGQPCLVVDKLQQYVRQVVNDSRQNRPGIKVRPVDSDADIETADIYQGLCRHIEERSNADTAYDTALECAVKGGHGFFRILSEYAHDKTFDLELAVKRVRNPLTISIDPDIQEPDGSDMKWGFVYEDIPEDDFESRWPDAAKIDWSDEKFGDWYGEKKIRVAEYWWIEEEDRVTHLLHDGSVCSDKEYQQAITEGLTPPPIKGSRTLSAKVVMWGRINGKEYLEGPIEWPGKWIPILPVWGNEVDIDGKLIHTSMFHTAKDAQRLYDYSRSAFAERVALTPKAPYIAADGQVDQYEDDWNNANRESIGVLKYTPQDVSGTMVPPPQRQPASDIPAGFAQDMQMSEHDIQGALGMYNASLGRDGNEKSGRAILARQREGDVTNFHYHDNLARAIRHAGRILVDLIPKTYDSTRTVRILGQDGTSEMADLDPTIPVASGKVNGKQVYNLGVGTYDVAVSAGPSYTTRRQEAAESMAQLTQANPALMGLIGDLMIRSMDWPQAEEIADRLKTMLPPQVLAAEQKKDGPPPEVAQIMQQAQQAMQQKDQQLHQIMQAVQQMQQENQSLKVAAEQANLKAQQASVKAASDVLKAEYKVADLSLKLDEQDAVSRVQQMAQPEAEPKEARPQGGEINDILQTIATMGNPIHVGVPDAGAAQCAMDAAQGTLAAADRINAAVEALTQVAGVLAQPKRKTGRAVKQKDGSYVMESIEIAEVA